MKVLNIDMEKITTTKSINQNKMNQNKMYRCIKLMEYLQEKSRNMNTIAKYLNVSMRTVYRYLKLYEALGYEVKKDMFNKVKLTK